MNKMIVKDIMSNEVYKVRENSKLDEAANLMKQKDIGCVAVCDDSGCCCGIVTDRDITVRCSGCGKEVKTTTVKDIMSKNITKVSPDMNVSEAVNLMSEHQVRRLPVEENGQMIGMITLGDVARCGCYNSEIGLAEDCICKK